MPIVSSTAPTIQNISIEGLPGYTSQHYMAAQVTIELITICERPGIPQYLIQAFPVNFKDISSLQRN